jgi:hypothetical protein
MKNELENKNISLDNNDNQIKKLQDELDSINKINNESNNNINKLISENNKLKSQIK